MRFTLTDSAGAAAETILLSAGLGGAAAYWAPQMAALAERYRVIVYDQAGTGANARPLGQDYAISDMADDVLAILDASGTPQCHFVGHALGALVGIELAHRASSRVRSLTLVNGWASADAHTRRCFAARLALLKHAGPEAYALAQPLFLYPATWLAANETRMVQEDAHAVAAFQGTETLLRRVDALLRFDATAMLATLRTPTLMVAARDDILVACSQSEHLAVQIPNAALEVLEWGGHAVNVTVPDQFNAALLSFLDAQARQQG